ncbi:MAG: TIGR03936 family radical SAM-associated protein [Huintestinicola sp.]|uniref:TIGR03936 family radical SAM-associated protein n=1 Tax=Huintestinicola sp. TaxID=2981661 RepID=UPI003F100F76
MDKKNIRVFFEKKDRAIYISHLDLLRTMQRALKRSGLPVWYSEGFNPRIYLNFPLALSLGTEGLREPMDMAVVEDVSLEEIAGKLNGACPEGIRILSAAYPVHPNKDIGFAEYETIFSGDTRALKGAVSAYISQESIKVMKHSKKKGMIEVDIKPHINIRGVSECENGIMTELRLPAGNELNLNCGVFTESFLGYCNSCGIMAELCCAKRTNILCADGAVFE